MANELMQRFVREIKKDTSLYQFYLDNPMVIQKEFYEFFKKQEKNNEYFAKIIQKHHFVKSKDHIIETALSKDIDSISDYLKNENKKKIVCRYGTIKSPICDVPTLENNSCYISNGFYENTEDTIKAIINYVYGFEKPSFIIGAVDRPDYEMVDGKLIRVNTDFFNENVTKIKKLQKELHHRHIPVSVYQESLERHSVYMLVHRGDRK